ncbi:MAG: hypothetical protein M3R30_02045 [Candidatus Eremiobacteraeota bacterium]|nr:hypothetical protein [Candidatus Eremiobacteraeota bacterium]
MPRLSLQSAALLAVLSLLAACSSGGTIPTPAPAPSAPTSVTLPVGSASAPAALPAASGAVATVSLSSASAPAGATIAVTYSASAPSGVAPLIAKRTALTGATILAYYTFTPSVNIPLNSFPAFTMTYPSSVLQPGTTIHAAFLDAGTQAPVYELDIAYGTNGAVLTSTASAPSLLAGKTYVFVFYYLAAVATPTPTATPTVAPTATPTGAPTATPGGVFLGSPAAITQVDTGGPQGATYFDGAIVVGADANLYIADQRADEIDVFNPATMTKVMQWPFARAGDHVPIRPAALALASDHRIWTAAPDDTNNVYALDPSTGALTAYPYAPPTADGDIARFIAGADGRMWGLTNLGLQVFTNAGVRTAYPFALAQGNCRDIVLGRDGDVWFGCGGNVGKATPSGTITLYPHGSHAPMTATVDGVWFDSSSSGQHLARIGYDGSGYVETSYPAYANDVHTMCAGPDGNIYVGSTSGLWEIPIGTAGTIGTGKVLVDYRASLNPDYYAMVVGPDNHSIWSGNDSQNTLRVTR